MLNRIIKCIQNRIMEFGVHYNEYIDAKTDLNFYYPAIPRNGFFRHDEPEIYNSFAQKYKVCFLSDVNSAHYNPYFYFDRYDWGLDTHFYRGENMLRTVGKPKYKYGFTNEPYEIAPYEYEIFNKYPDKTKDFEYIFTTSDRVLDKFANARYANFTCYPWYMKQLGCYDDEQYLKKTKNISIIASDKEMTCFHKLRSDVARRCMQLNIADSFGNAVNRFLPNYDDAFREYRFSIVIENSQSSYYFTEKITSCFAAHVVPIYLGATNISDFFNPDGIIIATERDFDDLERLLSKCTKKEYEMRKDAILDNYDRVKKMESGWKTVSDIIGA